MKIVLHACCGPCSTVPIKEFLEQGHQLEIFFSNSNIHPWAEYVLRRDTAAQYAKSLNIPFIEGTYNPKNWFLAVGDCRTYSKKRCSQCYKMRFLEPAQYAKETGADAIASSLTISPYQFTDEINFRLKEAASEYGVAAIESDFREQYKDSVEMSRNANMYRQNFCGCMYSQIEAQEQREAAAARRAEAKWLKKERRAQAAAAAEVARMDAAQVRAQGQAAQATQAQAQRKSMQTQAQNAERDSTRVQSQHAKNAKGSSTDSLSPNNSNNINKAEQ